MKDIIDIYTKIVVATFGFIGPSFTLLISIFIEAIEMARIKHEQQLKTINSLTRGNINDPDKDIEKEMKSSLVELKKQKVKIQRDLNLLNPKRQIRRVFIPLILSLVFIGLYYFQHTTYCPIENTFCAKLVWLLASGLLFLYCLFVLYQILYMVIESKQALIKEKTDLIVGQEP
jgi:hypothetical protein